MAMQNNVAVITGAGSGIGAALARNLADQGARLALADINGAALERIAHEVRAAGVEARHTMYRSAPHGFINFPGLTAAGYPALEELVIELRHHLHEELA